MTGALTETCRVLVAEKLADSGVDLLRERFDVDVGTDWTPEELAERIGDYHALLVRSATQVTEELLSKADNLRVIGRAGVGVDNVDVAAATKRGIIVANAPQSNIVTAAEHTIALLLALARNVPQAHSSLAAGKWERSKFGGVELYGKTLGILGFGRIGQLVAARAKGLEMRVLAYDPYVGAERYRELGVEQATDADQVFAEAEFITIHLPNTPDTKGFLNAEAFDKMRDGVRVLNVARGELLVDDDLVAAIESGKVGGAALDVFQTEPITEHPLFGHPKVVVTPHLGASTAEAQDRAGVQTAEQVVAALTGGTVTTAVNIPAVSPEDMKVVGPFLPLVERLARLGLSLAEGRAIEGVEVEYLGRIADRDTRLLTTSALVGLLAGHTEDDVNLVNAPSLAEARGIRIVETKNPGARDYENLVRLTVNAGGEATRVVGTTLGQLHRPHLLEVWGQRFNLQFDEGHLALFRYQDLPGMIGRVGTTLGEHGVNIVSAAVGRQPPGEDGGPRDVAVMAVTTDSPVPESVLAEISRSEGFLAGRSVTL